ncbi:hypothetical protein GGI07_000012 [Coemansia sp. Benny D115]|nr:hypothetical protein GGI07_000012 [Coemansia sp. Benny D115]
MSGFFSSLLGRSAPAETQEPTPAATTASSINYDTCPRLFPSPHQPVQATPGPTPEEQKLLNDMQPQIPSLLQDLPKEPQDNLPRFNARKWLTSERQLLYLRANKQDPEKTLKRLRASLEWHCQFRPHAITPEEMKLEGATGKQYVNGYDKDGRPLIYMFPHRENTKDAKGNLRWVVFTMEQALRAMPPGVTKLTIVIDVSQYSMSQAVPLSTAREFLHILESHYPERLHKALVLNPPRLFVMFYHIVAPFIDPVTKAKVAFVDGSKKKSDGADGPWVDILDHVDPDQLQSDVGGKWDFKYVQEKYWVELERSYDEWIKNNA